MNYWWVNQNQTFKAETQGGFLWSPKTNKNGARNQFYDNMTLVKSGDLIFSFCDRLVTGHGCGFEPDGFLFRCQTGKIGLKKVGPWGLG
jgi:hypothetical protein